MIAVDENGFYGKFGGAYIPEMLYPNIEELRENYLEITTSADFQEEFKSLLKDYVGRPTPLFLQADFLRNSGPRFISKGKTFVIPGPTR